MRHRIVVVAGLGLLISAQAVLAQSADLTGHWEGELELTGRTVAFDTDFASSADGLTGDLSIPVQNARDLILTEIVLADHTIAFRLPDAPGNASRVRLSKVDRALCSGSNAARTASRSQSS